MAIDIWGSDYKAGVLCDTREGGALSAAIKKETTPAQLWSRYSPDGQDWTAPPVLIGTLPEGVKAVQLRQRSDGALLITDGPTLLFVSFDWGDTWQPA